jgi:SAM-dependent methyltransferase
MGRSQWLLDEVASAGRENLDPGHVARYDAKEDAGAGDEVRLLAAVGLGSESVVVDVGAGTGQFALAAAGVCARVVAVDDVVQAGFLTYEHRGHPADVVYSRYALHHLPDFWKAVALARVRRVLRPGGLLRLSDVVYGFEPADAEERIEGWCATGAIGGLETEWSRGELEEHVRDEHSTFTWLLEPMIERAGFEITEAVHSDDGIFAKYLARAV